MRLVLIGIALLLIGVWIPLYVGRIGGGRRSFKGRILTLLAVIGFAELVAGYLRSHNAQTQFLQIPNAIELALGGERQSRSAFLR
jgi:hypothetical protein